jgi:hypothetical protein
MQKYPLIRWLPKVHVLQERKVSRLLVSGGSDGLCVCVRALQRKHVRLM